jgi:hypothetical protein
VPGKARMLIGDDRILTQVPVKVHTQPSEGEG